MCDGDKCGYVAAKVAAKDVPQFLIAGWNAAVLMGEYAGTLSQYIEDTYRLYVSRCQRWKTPDSIEVWLQNCKSDVYRGSGWVDRRVSPTEAFAPDVSSKQAE